MKIEIKPLYTVGEVATMLHFPAEKVRRMLNAGHLDSEKLGGGRYVTLASLQALPAVWESILLVAQLRPEE